MIFVTEQAKGELKKLLAAKVDWPGARLRLMDRGEGKLGLGVDIESPGDIVLEHEGVRLLLVEAGLASKLDDVILDVESGTCGAELVISQNC
jgi:Fe-S cluster assembly iron-binding protein IscA